MEKNMAILMADLSGYTAMTETHGASSAADLIEKYIDIVKTSLVGDSELHEITGDEVFIVSSSADHLLSTALMIHQATHNEDNFLQLHGALHYGKILKRNKSYFGTAINLTSRIASIADAGNFLCSLPFVNALAKKPETSFRSRGKYSFKNLSEEMEVFEMIAKDHKEFFVDPVCRMLIINQEKALAHPHLSGIYFCSSGCLERFSQAKISGLKFEV
jgi:adenylate cyclase